MANVSGVALGMIETRGLVPGFHRPASLTAAAIPTLAHRSIGEGNTGINIT